MVTPPKRPRGRPPKGENMGYWRIYISPELRARLDKIRGVEKRRLNDILIDMVDAYLEKRGRQ